MKGSELKKLRVSVSQTAKNAADDVNITERTWFRWESKEEIRNFAIIFWMDLHNIKDIK